MPGGRESVGSEFSWPQLADGGHRDGLLAVSQLELRVVTV